jgi:hypothetical protein
MERQYYLLLRDFTMQRGRVLEAWEGSAGAQGCAPADKNATLEGDGAELSSPCAE